MLLLLMPLLLVVVAGDDITAATVNPPLVGTLLWDWPSLLANRRLIAHHHDSGAAAQQSRAVARAVGALLSVANASAGELELIKFRTLTCSHTCVLFLPAHYSRGLPAPYFSRPVCRRAPCRICWPQPRSSEARRLHRQRRWLRRRLCRSML